LCIFVNFLLFEAKINADPNAECGEKFVDGNLDENIVIPRLTAACDFLLDKPITERAEDAGEKSSTVGEDGSKKDCERGVKKKGVFPPEFGVPPKPKCDT